MAKAKGATFLVILGLCIGGSLGGMYWLGKRAKETPHAPVAKPPALQSAPQGAFRLGGRPDSEGPARALFRDQFPQFVIELDAWLRRNDGSLGIANAKEELSELRGRMVAAAREALPEGSRGAFLKLVDIALHGASVDDSSLDQLADEIAIATLALNDALATEGRGFFIDSEVLTRGTGRNILFFSFEVERVILYRSGGHDVRTLRIRRLDNLNWRYNLLGFTSPRRRDAVVLDDRVTKQLLDYLPLIADSVDVDPFHLPVEDTWTPWYKETRSLARKVIADEFAATGEKDIKKLSQLLARRLEIYGEWNEALSRRGAKLDPPETLEVEWKYREQMVGLVPKASMDELDELQRQLVSEEMLATYAAAHEHFAQSVERHEAQHRLDLAQLYRVNMPPELAHYTGELPQGYRGEGGRASASLAELSAYLSELARDPLTPRTNLTHLLSYLITKRVWGTRESYAALVIFEGLAKELGIEHAPLTMGRSIQRGEVAKIYQKLCGLPADELRTGARKVWERYIDADFPVLETISR